MRLSPRIRVTERCAALAGASLPPARRPAQRVVDAACLTINEFSATSCVVRLSCSVDARAAVSFGGRPAQKILTRLGGVYSVSTLESGG